MITKNTHRGACKNGRKRHPAASGPDCAPQNATVRSMFCCGPTRAGQAPGRISAPTPFSPRLAAWCPRGTDRWRASITIILYHGKYQNAIGNTDKICGKMTATFAIIYTFSAYDSFLRPPAGVKGRGCPLTAKKTLGIIQSNRASGSAKAPRRKGERAAG